MKNWRLEMTLKGIGKELTALESFRITDHLNLGKFGQRMLDLSKDVESAANLIDRGKATSEQMQSFVELLPRIAGLSQKAFTSSAEVAQRFLPPQPEDPPR